MNHDLALRVVESPWAIRPDTLRAILATIQSGGQWPDAVPEAAAARQRQSSGGIAVIPVYGVITHRDSFMSAFFGGTSVERLRAEFRQAVADDTIRTVVLAFDSPGGSVSGIEEMAAEIYQARSVKRIVAIADTLSASAAYFLATQASELSVTPSGDVGSIGVYATHQDVSKMAEMAGIKVTLISAGRFKTEGNPFEELSDEARASIQSRVNEHYAAFTAAVARGRGVKASDVRNGFGEARSVSAREAVKLGMADRVETFDGLLRRLGVAPNAQRIAADDDLFDLDIAAVAEAEEEVVAEATPTVRTAAGQREIYERRMRLVGVTR